MTRSRWHRFHTAVSDTAYGIIVGLDLCLILLFERIIFAMIRLPVAHALFIAAALMVDFYAAMYFTGRRRLPFPRKARRRLPGVRGEEALRFSLGAPPRPALLPDHRQPVQAEA